MLLYTVNTHFIVISQNEHETQFLQMIKLFVSFHNGDIVSVIIMIIMIMKIMIMRLEEQ